MTRRGILKVAIAFLLALVGVYVFYLAAGNIFIRTNMLRGLLNKGPDKTFVDYDSAVTYWPGRVRVRGLLVRDRDRLSEWAIRFEEATARISLLDLVRQQFRASHIRGTGFQARVRSRLLPEELIPDLVASLPSIPGFTDPPLRDPAEQKPPTGDEWKVLLEDVLVPVKEIWVDDWRYTGESLLEGGMFLHGDHRLEVFPSTLRVTSGVLTLRKRPIGASLDGRIDARIHSLDLGKVRGAQVLEYLAGTGTASGRIEDMGFLDVLLDSAPRLRFSGGHGTISAVADLMRGGQGAGFLDFDADGVESIMADAGLRGRAKGRVNVSRLDLQEGIAEFKGSRLELGHVISSAARAGSEPWWGRMELTSGRLKLKGTERDPAHVFSAHVEARARDARPLYGLLNIQLPGWAERIMTLESLSVSSDLSLGRKSIGVSALEVRGGAFEIAGRYRSRGAWRDGALLIESGRLALGVEITPQKTGLKILRAKKWFREMTETTTATASARADAR